MELESLSMYREYSGKVSGQIKFKGGAGSVELTLDEAAMQRILAVCADRLVEQAQEASNNLKAAVIEATTQPALTNEE